MGQKVDLIVALSPAAIRAARAATKTIPIVVSDLESDPLSTGFIAANRRPGGNVTGVFLDFPDFSKKWLQALKEVVPQNSTVAVLWDPIDQWTPTSSCRGGSCRPQPKAHSAGSAGAGDLEHALQSAVGQNAGGVVALSSPLIGGNTKLLAKLAMKYRLPGITLFSEFAREGGLMAYGPSILAVIRHEGVIAAKILSGANPAETPIETPTRFEFVLNLKTAKALGIVIPAPTLLRADEVIE